MNRPNLIWEMSRRNTMAGRITKSEEQLQADPRYNNKVLAKFINCLMHDGKKSVAQRVMYDSLDKLKTRIQKESDKSLPENELDAFIKAIENVKPDIEVRSKRIGGANYQVPMPVNAKRRQSLAFRWILAATRGEKGRPMSDRLARELFDACRGEGKSITKKNEVHRMAEANRAFSHFAR